MEPAKVAAANKPDTADVVALQVGVVVVAGLYLGREMLIPITLAILLSFILSPLVNLFRRVLPRVLAVVLAVALALGVVVGLGGLIGMQVASLVPNVPQYAEVVDQKLEAVRGYAADHFSFLMNRIQERATPAPQQQHQAGGGRAPLPVQVIAASPTPLQMAERVLDPLASPLSTAAIVFVFAIFVLVQREDLRDRMIRLFGSGDLHRTTQAMDDAGRRLSRYFLAQAGLNVLFGCVIGLGLWLIGLPSPALWGVLSAMLRFVPYVGAVLAAGLPLALAAARRRVGG